jgi:phosphatidate cytidylyltransferase
MPTFDAAPVGTPTGRAGRNLPAAITVGVGLGIVIIASLFVEKAAFLGVVGAAAVLGLVELSQALSVAGIRIPLIPVVAGGLAMIAVGYFSGPEWVPIAMALTVLSVVLWRLRLGADGFVRDISAGIFALSYVPLLGTFVVLLLADDDGAWRVVTFIVVTIASDIGGYAVGVLFGRHLMAPSISPRKSWEGFGGSVAACLVAGCLTVVYALDGDWWVGLVLGGAAVVVATLGDLAESMMKRDLGIKDMGTLLPGHGGVLDRIDSLLAVAPVAWLILHALVPVS